MTLLIDEQVLLLPPPPLKHWVGHLRFAPVLQCDEIERRLLVPRSDDRLRDAAAAARQGVSVAAARNGRKLGVHSSDEKAKNVKFTELWERATLKKTYGDLVPLLCGDSPSIERSGGNLSAGCPGAERAVCLLPKDRDRLAESLEG